MRYADVMKVLRDRKNRQSNPVILDWLPYFATTVAKAMVVKKATKGIACITLRPCRMPVSRE
jgi:hypothetical protein